MDRRTILGAGVCLLLGCGGGKKIEPTKPDEPAGTVTAAAPPIPLETMRNRVRDRITGTQPTLAVEFGPVLVGLLAQFLLQLVSQCLLSKIKAQHKAINRHPDGTVAKRWKEQVGKSFRVQQAAELKRISEEYRVPQDQIRDWPNEAVDHYVDGAFLAFKNATEAELEEMAHSVQNSEMTLTDDEWRTIGEAARNLSTL